MYIHYSLETFIVYMYVMTYIHINISSQIYTFNVNDAFCCYIIILYFLSKTLNYLNTHIYIMFYKTTIQTYLCLFSICWFYLWVHVTNCIVNIFKFIIHSLLIFRWRTNNIPWLFHQIKSYILIGIIYPTCSHFYSMIEITMCINQLN